MSMTQKCIVIHPQNFWKYFQYTKIVRLLFKSYKIVTIIVKSENVQWVKGLYHDLVEEKKVVIHSVDNSNFDVNNKEILSFILDASYDLKAYEEFDQLRISSDPCKGKIKTITDTSPDQILTLYNDDYNSSKHYSEIEFIIARDLKSETIVINKLKEIIQFRFAIISDDKYKNICHENEMNCINIKKLFPRNNRISLWIQLLQKAVFIVVSDDEVAGFVYTLQQDKVKGKQLLSKKQKVYFILPPKKKKEHFPYKNWIFI